jgi:hypothetical protein
LLLHFGRDFTINFGESQENWQENMGAAAGFVFEAMD